jgi:hypothetical protein
VTVPFGANPANDLLRYFEIRRAWEDRLYSSLTEADLLFRNQAKQQFGAPRFEQLYRRWKAGSMQDWQVREEFQGNGAQHIVQFESRVLQAVGQTCPESEEDPCRTEFGTDSAKEKNHATH